VSAQLSESGQDLSRARPPGPRPSTCTGEQSHTDRPQEADQRRGGWRRVAARRGDGAAAGGPRAPRADAGSREAEVAVRGALAYEL